MMEVEEKEVKDINIHDAASKVIELIFEMYPNGVSLADIKDIYRDIKERFSNVKHQISED
jgi:predicted transcriptional regulator with HTH domain